MRALRTGVLLVAAGMTPLPAAAQVQAPRGTVAETVVQTVHGVVVGSVDGKPVARALVTSGDQRMAVMTDSEGRFRFELRRPMASGAQAGAIGLGMGRSPQQMTVLLMARRPGYLPTQVPVILAFAEDLPVVQLKLVPEGVIRGRVTLPAGDVPDGLTVQLRRRSVQDGFAAWSQAGGAQVNSRGEYRFAELPAGEYQVMAQRWAEPQAFLQNAPESRIGYPPVFNGDAGDAASARTIVLRAGETAEAELHVRGEMMYRVSVPVKGVPQGTGIGIMVGEDDGVGGPALQYNARTQTITGYLPKGVFPVRVNSFGQPQMMGTGRVEVAGGMAVEGAPIQMQPAGSIAVHVREEMTAQPAVGSSGVGVVAMGGPGGRGRSMPRALDLSLQAVGGLRMGGNMAPNASDPDDLTIQNVQEGTYRVRAQAFRGYIAAMTSGGVDLLQRPLVVGKGGVSEPIEVTLRDDTASLSGTITGLAAGGEAAYPYAGMQGMQALLMCLPLDTPMLRPATGGSFGGKIEMQNLAPGRYLVLAVPFQAMATLEYGNPEVLERLKSKGTLVTLSAGQKAQIEVPMFAEEAK